MHEWCHQGDLPSRYLKGKSRHLYDIICLHHHIEQQGRYLKKSLFNALRRHRQLWYGRKSTTFRSSTLQKLCFHPPHAMLGDLMDDYRALRKDVIFDRTLEFPVLLGKIQQINAWVNGMEGPYVMEAPARAVGLI